MPIVDGEVLHLPEGWRDEVLGVGIFRGVLARVAAELGIGVQAIASGCVIACEAP